MFIESYWDFLSSKKEPVWDLVDYLCISFPSRSSLHILKDHQPCGRRLYQWRLGSRLLTFLRSPWFAWRAVAHALDLKAYYFPFSILCRVSWSPVDKAKPFALPGSSLRWLHWNCHGMVVALVQAFFCCLGGSGDWEMSLSWPTSEH